MDSKVKLAVIGLGHRGPDMLNLLLQMDDVEIVGVCDVYEDRTKAGYDAVVKAGRPAPLAVADYRRLLDLKELDAVFTPSSWSSHVQICLDAMDSGRYAATEVGGAYSVEECWELVRAYERTRVPFMMMENCCYGREEMMVLNMVKQGLFGETVHAEGGYRHDLRGEICRGREIRHYRLENYSNRNGELYPTHEIGPIAKWLGINRGNRFTALASFASKQAGLTDWIERNPGPHSDLASRRFTQGDVVTTILKCAHGETVTLTHDTSLPRAYSRGNVLQGTRGIWCEDRHGMYIEGVSPKSDSWCENWQDISELYGAYEHPLWKVFRQEGVKGGHGGMDWLVLRGFVEAVKNRTQTPIDVYDSVAWMAITPLSEDSVAMGGQQVAFPDFTRGKWMHREAPVEGTYCLEKVCPVDIATL